MSISYNLAKLSLKVDAKNYHASIANISLPQIIDSIRPLVGTKIYLASGKRAKKFDELIILPESSSGNGRSFHFAMSSEGSYSLKIHLNVSMWEGGLNVSNDAVYYIGDLEQGGTVLKAIKEFDIQKENWDATDIKSKIIAADRAEEEYEKAKRLIPEEFRSNNY